MVEALLTELPPERTSTAAAQRAHRASTEWEQKYETVATWFEAGGAVEDLLRPLRTRKRRIEAVSTQLLSGKTDILGRTLRLDGRDTERGGR